MWQKVPDFLLVVSVEEGVALAPDVEDELQGGLSGGSGDPAQEVQHRFQLVVDEVGEHQQQALLGREGRY